MSATLSVISLILVVVILLSFQLTPATFSIFYHYALGKHSNKKADDLSLSFILGVEFYIATVWLSSYLIIYSIFVNLPDFRNHILLWILAGIVVAEAIIFFFYYFRRDKSRRASTALFIPRRFSTTITTRAQQAKTRRDVFVLGFFTGVPELIFTLPLFAIGSLLLMNSIILPSTLTTIIVVLLATVPLFVIRIAFRSGNNLASIQRFRAFIKPALRLFTPLCLLALALTLINLGLL